MSSSQIQSQPVRINGITSPPHNFQIASWFLYLFFLVTFYVLYVPYPGLGGQISSGIIFGLGALATILAAGRATSIDPADKAIFDARNQDIANSASSGASGHVRSRSSRESRPGHLYCYRCECLVLESSKHCMVCNKCVDTFDHHCVWLNNCVGKHNYISFLSLLISSSVMLIVPVTMGVYILVDYTTQPVATDSRVRQFYPSLSGAAFLAIILTIGVLALTTLSGVLQLFIFHAFLVLKNQTTYEYIMGRLARQRAADAGEEESAEEVTETRNQNALTASISEMRQKHASGVKTDPGSAFILYCYDFFSSRKEAPVTVEARGDDVPAPDQRNDVRDQQQSQSQSHHALEIESRTSPTRNGEDSSQTIRPLVDVANERNTSPKVSAQLAASAERGTSSPLSSAHYLGSSSKKLIATNDRTNDKTIADSNSKLVNEGRSSLELESSLSNQLSQKKNDKDADSNSTNKDHVYEEDEEDKKVEDKSPIAGDNAVFAVKDEDDELSSSEPTESSRTTAFTREQRVKSLRRAGTTNLSTAINVPSPLSNSPPLEVLVTTPSQSMTNLVANNVTVTVKDNDKIAATQKDSQTRAADNLIEKSSEESRLTPRDRIASTTSVIVEEGASESIRIDESIEGEHVDDNVTSSDNNNIVGLDLNNSDVDNEEKS
jgi:hypothetical protein